VILTIIFMSAVSSSSQDRDFVAGTALGFYGIHIQGDIREMYSSTSGTIWGTGGLSFGLNVKRHLTNSLYGALELRYARKGSLYEFVTIHGTQGFESIKLDYIELPLLLGIRIKLKKRYLLFETGFAYARLIKAKMLVNSFNQWDPSSKMDLMRRNDFPFIANVKYPVTRNERLLVGFRFSYSMSSIHSYYKLYNMNYGIEVYYTFNRSD